jgi:hypothetical protein
MGMPQKITDEEGNIAWNAQYKARGEAKEITSKKAAQGAGFKNPLKLQGQYVDLSIDGANRHDMKQVKNIHWTTSWLPVRRRQRGCASQGLCLDKGYDFDEVRDIVKAFGLTARIRARGEETRVIKQEAGFEARRWVVERTQQLDESLSPNPRAPRETPPDFHCHAAPRLRHHHLARYWSNEIGS